MEGACGTWRCTTGTRTVEGSGRRWRMLAAAAVLVVVGGETTRVDGWTRAPVRSTRSLREKVSVSMGMSVTGVRGSERGASCTARRCVGSTGEVRLSTASSYVFVS